MAIPLLVGAGLLAAAAAGSAAAGAAKVGKNPFHSNSFADTKEYDPTHFMYGGNPYGAKDQADAYHRAAMQLWDRKGPQLNDQFVRGQRENDAEARTGQMRVADLMERRANGLVPSIAQMQADRQMQQLSAAQNSAAAGARGPGAIALAQQNAMGAMSAGSASISNAAQINAAQERLAAEQAAFGARSGIRGGDQNAQGLEQQFSGKQGDLDLGTMGLNQQGALGYDTLGNQVNEAQLNAYMRQQEMLSRDKASADQINAGVNQANADKEQARVNGLTGGITGMIGGMFGSDVRLKQGVAPIGYGLMSDAAAKTNAFQLGAMSAMNVAKNYMTSSPTAGLDPYNYADRPSLDRAGGWAPGTSDDILTGGASSNNYSLDGHGNSPPPWMRMQAGVTSDINAKQNVAPMGGTMQPQQFQAAAPQQQRFPAAAPMQQPQFQQAAPQPQFQQAPRAADPVTSQLAQGLAPYSYQYKPGMGPAGPQVGPMAQNMAANPITAPAVMTNPQNGMLNIDRDAGLKSALGGVGHLAARQAQTDQQLQALTQQRQGLMQPRPQMPAPMPMRTGLMTMGYRRAA